MDTTKLFEPPFADLHVGGVAGVLGNDAGRVVEVIERINRNVLVG